jgi:hypothetical protein
MRAAQERDLLMPRFTFDADELRAIRPLPAGAAARCGSVEHPDLLLRGAA